MTCAEEIRTHNKLITNIGCDGAITYQANIELVSGK